MKIKPNDDCFCNSGLKYKACCQLNPEKFLKQINMQQLKDNEFTVTNSHRIIPAFIQKPSYAESGHPPRIPRTAAPCSQEVIAKMRNTCQIAAKILKLVCAAVKPGITTQELDDLAFNACIAEGAYPSPLNYHFFPKSICTSVNNIICHGIPNNRPLKDGDIVNIDVTVFKNGVHGDTNTTVLVGENVSEVVKKLVEVTKESLEKAIEVVKPGIKVKDIGAAIEKVIKPHNYGIVETFCGHGIGEEFHNSLYIPHFFDPRENTIIKEGMIFTIEPMITLGRKEEKIWKDQWTAATKDGLPSAQFEHTILVTASGAEILTIA